MAVGHLVAATLTPSSSPVLAVGATVIDRTPTPMKEWAVRELGTKDKPVLLGSVLLVTLLLAGLAGLIARRRRAAGATVLITLVGLAGLAALSRPLATARDLLPALAAGAVGVAVLLGLAHLADRTTGTRRGGAGATGPGEPPPDHPMTAAASPATTRRTLLLAVLGVAAATAVTGWAGRSLEKWRTRISGVRIPTARQPLPPLPEGLDAVYDGISDFQTATGRFYRVDINLSLPIVPPDEWDLRIDGEVDHPFTLTFDELRAMPLVERDITLTCVSNEVGGKYVGSARWRGVLLSTLLDRAGVRDGADQVLSTAADGFTISTPLAAVQDGRDAMVAIAMNGEPLPAEHGFPARLVTPGLYGYVGATKWLRKLTLTRYDDAEAYWTERGWATEGPIKVSSRIDTPAPLSRIDAGRTVIGGVAWAQHRGVKGVEVRIDGGPWQAARLGPSAGIDYWRQWYLPWEATPGRHSLAVRATTRDGEVQTAVRATPFPNGSSGIQEIQVVVE
ncbi:molybdopterin-dependent oxidoreductase [Nocardioides daejeonensis]|uniref:molybdopterin-dependent oxidoreductase n=1 Tax=Nocardioides daejeonensis TaxID=1046556 RepID=UPI0019510A58|nr:molybdopterin-dependent oxidoreductase [Nocardioides daejeonensis]